MTRGDVRPARPARCGPAGSVCSVAVHRLAEVAMLELQVAPGRASLASPVLPSTSSTYLPPKRGEVQVFDLVGAVDLVERERFRDGQIQLLVQAEVLHLGLEQERDAGGPRRHEELVGRFAILEQLEVAHFLAGGDAVEIGAGDHQPHLFQHLERHRPVAEPQHGADHAASALRRESSCSRSTYMPAVERVAFRLVMELAQRAELAAAAARSSAGPAAC